MEGWISIHRHMIDWEWFSKPEMVQIFIYFLLMAQHRETSYRGINLSIGEFITSKKRISHDTGLTEQTVRTCINRLISTKEITIKTTNKFSIVTICKYVDYQNTNIINNKQKPNKSTIKKQTANQQSTTCNNVNNFNNENNKGGFEFKQAIMELGVSEQTASDFMQVRKDKNASNTITAFKEIKKQIKLSGASAEDCIRTAAGNSWQTFKYDWLNKQNNKNAFYEKNNSNNFKSDNESIERKTAIWREADEALGAT